MDTGLREGIEQTDLLPVNSAVKVVDRAVCQLLTKHLNGTDVALLGEIHILIILGDIGRISRGLARGQHVQHFDAALF